MRIIVAECSVEYHGRGQTFLDRADRTIMVKQDNSIIIHGLEGVKPLNYMMGDNTHSWIENDDSQEKLLVVSKDNEEIIVILHNIYSDETFDNLRDHTSGLQRKGTEKDLQKWLLHNLHDFMDTELNDLQREYATGAGPVDLFAYDNNGTPLAIEVKRYTNINTPGQVLRYVNALEKTLDEKVKGVIAAVDFNKTAEKIAREHDIQIVRIPSTWVIDFENNKDQNEGTLFENLATEE